MQHVKEKCKTLEKETMLVCQALSERDAEKICVNVCVRVCVCEREKVCAEVCQGILLPGYIFNEEKQLEQKVGRGEERREHLQNFSKKTSFYFFIEMSFSLLTFAFFLSFGTSDWSVFKSSN